MLHTTLVAVFYIFTLLLYTIQPIQSFTVGNYKDSKCTQYNTAEGQPQQYPNDSCIQNPSNSGESVKIHCNTQTSDSTYTFTGYMSGDCSGPAIINDSNEKSLTSCLNVGGNYFAVDCSNTGSQLRGISSSGNTTPTFTTATLLPTTTVAVQQSVTTGPTNLFQSANDQAVNSTSGSVPNISYKSNSYQVTKSYIVELAVLVICFLL